MSIATGQNASAQDIIKGVAHYAADAGGSDAYVISLPTAPSAYADGLTVRFKANTANTTGATLNVNSLGAIAILRPDASALRTGDILANQVVEVVYRSSNFYLTSPVGTEPPVKAGVTSRDLSTASGSQTIAHGLARSPRLVKLTAHFLGNTATAPDIVHSVGSFDGTNHACAHSYLDWGNTVSSDTSTAFEISLATSNASYQRGVVSVDATNITITWTKTGSPTGTVYFTWEAYG